MDSFLLKPKDDCQTHKESWDQAVKPIKKRFEKVNEDFGPLSNSPVPFLLNPEHITGHVPPEGGPGDSPGHPGGTMSFCWPGNASGFPQKS
ncbi:hypothetical protein ILYODFUR_016868 [Ilyodon furcidens]|uniref:Uncharacterized protein n=1 Tax=Ilyodon furcidens TaxID=33524 RepID=A0ABV0SLV8_9TELE